MKNVYFLMSVVLLWTVSSCTSIKPLEFDGYNNVKLNTTGSKAQCNIDILLKNPNKVGCTLKNTACKVTINSIYIGDVTLRHKVHVGAGKVVIIPISFETDILTLAPLLKAGVEMILHKDIKVPVVVDAETTVKKFFIKKTFKYKFQQDYSFKDIRN